MAEADGTEKLGLAPVLFDDPKKYEQAAKELSGANVRSDVREGPYAFVIDAEHHSIDPSEGSKRSTPITYLDPVSRQNQSDDDLPGGCFNTVGIALSGGGIRSAAFCTGALQGMETHGVLDKIDYMSTVSGGGYVGAAYSVSLLNSGKFPFLSDSRDEKTDTPAMQQLRANANYLKFGHPIEMLKNFAIYLRGLVANCLWVVPLIFFLASITLFWNPDRESLTKAETPFRNISEYISWFAQLGPLAFSLIMLVLASVLYVLWSLFRSTTNGSELRGRFLWLGRWSLVVLATILFLEIQPLLVNKMLETSNAQSSYSAFLNRWMTFLAPFLAIMSFAAKYLGDVLKVSEEGSGWRSFVKKLTSQVIMIVVGLALPALLWLVYLRLVYWGVDLVVSDHWFGRNPPLALKWLSDFIPYETANSGHRFATLYLLVSGFGLFLWIFLTANGNSLHRLYRDRLNNAFCFAAPRDNDGELKDVKLSTLSGNRPYQLINSALNIQRQESVNKHGRNADFFLFSPCYIGSKSTGYVATPGYETVISNLTGYKTDLATATAISGAAASSNMGSETIKLFSATLALLNVRLGYWFPNPLTLVERTKMILKSTFNPLYFAYEVFGALDLKSGDVYLTDGGHIENLGAYELLRRRCRLIIIVDAEADKGMNFSSLIKLQRYARIDLGARITLDWSGIRKVSLTAQMGNAKCQDGPHCAIGRIDYDHKGTGILVYIKSSVTGDENDYVRDYNRRYRDFPHENTSDQFFNEEQFEVYRALGFHAANGVFGGEDLVQTSQGLVSLRDANARGFGVAAIRDILGLKTLPTARLPKRPQSTDDAEAKPQPPAK